VKKFSLLLTISIIIAYAATVFAYRLPNDGPSDSAGRMYDALAPTVCGSVSLGNKGTYNLPTANVSKIKFWFTKTTDDTSKLGMFKPNGSLSTWNGAGSVKTSGETVAVGKSVSSLGFANLSSATAATFNYCYQP